MEDYATKNKIDLSGIDRPCIIDGQVADTVFLKQFENVSPAGLDLGEQIPTSNEGLEMPVSTSPEMLDRMFNLPSAEHEAEESVSEVPSSQPLIKQTFPNWGGKSIEVAAAIVDYMNLAQYESTYESEAEIFAAMLQLSIDSK
ncbi:hypothetical protein [Leptolyngbya sp. FACHB-17]|uniref:hypothetical protein n=1 Tax=unclassified Leptolyngbya TaxID=2650499 RepID=UPI001680C5DA|nr:hypothetical protein [Leptolyngbya sp. FACHB-17]MBD2079145.1 hypothetical protein [Leptolyngbya sp. FACHB-17]